MNPGSGPSIGVLDLGYNDDGFKRIGRYDEETNSILLDISIVNEMQEASGDDLMVYKQLMEALVLHEETHRGVAKTGIDTKGNEPGYQFEKKAYGGRVDTYRSAAIVLNNKNIEVNNPKRYKLK